MQDHKQLIYIYGLGRSGTTLLGQVFGQGNDARCLGEFIRFAATDDLTRKKHPNSKDVRDLPCGCGLIGSECDENALTRYLCEYDLFKVEKYFSLSSLIFPIRAKAELFFQSMKKMYNGYSESTIIDTSKNARILFFLRHSPSFRGSDIRGVFIYRNIGDVWRSWRSDKDYLSKKSHPDIFKNVVGGLFWCFIVFFTNRRSDLFIKFSELRTNPEKVIARINREFKIDVKITDRCITMTRENHEVAGNPSKLQNKKAIVIK